jgi:hypothetical protein
MKKRAGYSKLMRVKVNDLNGGSPRERKTIKK